MTPEILKKRLSENIKSARKAKKYSQEKLAEAANISSQMVNDIEGCRRWPSDKTLTKLANALGIDVYLLFSPVKTVDSSQSVRTIEKEVKNNVITEIHHTLNQLLDNMIEQ